MTSRCHPAHRPRTGPRRFAVLRRAAVLCAAFGTLVTLAGCDEILRVTGFGLVAPYGDECRPAPGPGRPIVAPSSSPPALRRAVHYPTNDQRAWSLLRDRCDLDAQRLFAREVRERPGNGLPLAGYALSAAAAGDLTEGAEAMRAVLHYDPAALDAVPEDHRLRQRVEEITASYHDRVACGGLDRDIVLALGVLYYLMDDLDSARSAAALCRRRGDRTRAVHHFEQTISRPPRVARVSERSSAPPLTGARSSRSSGRADPRRAQEAQQAPHAPQTPDRLTASALPPAPFPSAGPPPAERSWPEALLLPSDDAAQGVQGAQDTQDATERPGSPEDSQVIPPSDPTPPAEPIDYDALRDDILDVSDTLDRFSEKLLRAIEDAGRS